MSRLTLPLTHLCTSDIAGRLRGKALPSKIANDSGDLTVGWTPTNVQITCFDNIAESPFGALGDLLLVGDLATRTRLDFGDGGAVEDFMLGDIQHLDGRPWECCTRSILKRALQRLEDVAGLTLFGAFEHEFHLPAREGRSGEGYGLAAFRSERPLLEAIMGALRAANVEPDTIMKEYGPNQFEVTVKPTVGHAIADQAAMLREVVRITGERRGRPVSFAPLIEPGGIGNGVHIHLSFRDADGRPVAYDPKGPNGMSKVMGKFVAGVLKHLPSILAFLAPSVVSYERLVPHRWSAAFNNLGFRDREAAIRICPIRENGSSTAADQFNIEVRACDAAASPHLALAAIVFAGVSGIEDKRLKLPEATSEDLSELDEKKLEERGFRRLPVSLGDALKELEQTKSVRRWFGDKFVNELDFVDIYRLHKQGEITALKGQDAAGVCDAYQKAY